MTDREALIAMFDRAGIVWREDTDNARPDVLAELGVASILGVHQGDGPNNEGYNYFWADFSFNAEGALMSVGAWE